MPAEATLVYLTADGVESRQPMSTSLKDPIFAARVSQVQAPLTYHVELGDELTPEYQVTVFEYPRLERADALLAYPQYTGLESRLVQDVRTVSVVEGTELTLRCYLNKPVATATLVETRTNVVPETISLAPSPVEPLLYEVTITCDHTRRLRLDLVDDAGRASVKPAHFSINVSPNLPPSLKPLFPARDLEVSALEELDVKASVWDDFGAQRIGMTYSLAGKEPVDIVLREGAAGREKHEIAHVIRLEQLGAEPDQLLTYHWWVEDFDASGKTRRTLSDMYFAEVRPYEEIFRQGEQPPGGSQQERQQQQQQEQGQNAQDAQELAKLQKDIINATWKLIRREVGSTLTDDFASDAEQIQLSQAAAREQATALAERVTDEQSQEHVEAVLRHMQTAADHLQEAFQTPSTEQLQPALAAEQAAYQSLLRLRAREHEVVRQEQQQSQQSSQQQQSQSRSQQQQQQLQQLDLREEENRYETERAAQERTEQETAEERENRQVLNRLRELARRQHDLNERLKELQSALEEAQTTEEEEEIKRQLQRLHDEQRQVLQDTDELQSRLEQPENLEQMSEEREQLQETREEVRRASEALEEGQVTQAAAAGTRAEQQFDELREEFRRRASNRFQEEMQEMRQAARQLDERQQALGEQLRGEEQQPMNERPSLREEDDAREQVAEELREQRERLANLQDQIRDTIERAEETEPILTQRLYDAARELQDRNVERTLQSTERSVRQGLAEDAREQEAAASEGIRELREGIERAAEGVLGDETEALRRARAELQDLARELSEEIARNNPSAQQPGEGDPGEGQPSQQAPGEQQPSERQPGQGQPGQREPGEAEEPAEGQRQPGQQPGQGQPGQRQPGSGQPGEPMEGEPMENQPGQPQKGEPQEGQPMNQPGQNQPGQTPGRGQPGERPNEGQPGERQPGQQPGQRQQQRLGDPSGFAGGGPFEDYVPREAAPLTGEEFREWSDRLRDVEEMVEDPALRADAARIRERARAMRIEIKRHSAEPNWDLVEEEIGKPLAELENRVAEELLRRASKKALVPLDRDPVPPQYTEKTRRYYERLGSGK
jgi:hypothetical protein